MDRLHKFLGKRPYRWIGGTLLLLALLAACSNPEVIEVTRVVTETVTVEVEAEPVEVEVTRVVTETITETVVEEFETEDGEDVTAEEPAPPSATGSEDDSGPLPPAPDDGPKVTTRTGASTAETGIATEVILETAVPRRSNPVQVANATQPTLISVASATNTTEWQKWCQRAQATHKKWCS